MKFPELLVAAIQRSEIPLRFEPGAEEAVAKPLIDSTAGLCCNATSVFELNS